MAEYLQLRPSDDLVAGVLVSGSFLDHRASSAGLRLAIRQHVPDQLKLGDWLAELLALEGMANALVDQPLAKTDGDVAGG